MHSKADEMASLI